MLGIHSIIEICSALFQISISGGGGGGIGDISCPSLSSGFKIERRRIRRAYPKGKKKSNL